MVSVREEKTREDYKTLEYLIFFIERPGRDWWDYLFNTREGFRHCFVMQWCEWSNRWIMVDWRQSRTDFIVLFDFEAEMFMRCIGAQKGTVVRFRPINAPDTGSLITYCSNIISRFLGLGNRIILTPYGLYRRLLTAGGEVVFSWRDENAEEENEQVREEADTA